MTMGIANKVVGVVYILENKWCDKIARKTCGENGEPGQLAKSTHPFGLADLASPVG